MKRDVRKMILAAVVRKAKDLTDEEILSLYHSVKEKLQGQSKPGEQVIPETPGPEPAEQIEEEKMPSQEETDTSSEDSIDDLLKDLGLDEDEEPQTAELGESNEALKPEVQETPPEQNPEPQEVNASVEPESLDVPEITTGQDSLVTRFEDDKTEKMIEKITERLLKQDEFSPDKFKTASKGQQLNRKDKDLMADGVTKPKYGEGEGIRAPRLDERDPNAVRYKKNEADRDPENDNDKDVKTSSVD